MSKSNFFIKNLKNFNKNINSLLEKNLNKLNFHNLRNLTKNNIIILTFVAFLILFVSYLLIPTFYKQSEVLEGLSNELKEKFKLNFTMSKNLNYNIFPRPHFITSDATIIDDKNEISKIKNLKIYLSLDDLFSLNNLEINDVVIENANFNLNKQNYNFFFKILENSFTVGSLKIKNSNIFFRNYENEVLFINKIQKLKYYYDSNELKNIAFFQNEIFNLPYSIELFNDKKENKYYSKFNLNFFKLQIENVINYNFESKIGSSQIMSNKKKSIVTYEISKNFFKFNFFDKLENPTFFYKGDFNFSPFYSSFEGNTEKLNLNYFFKSNSIITQLLKTEILNNKNIDFKLNIDAKNIHNNFNFKKLNIKSKIQDGLIDFDNTIFHWKNIADFKLIESLIYVKDGELVLDGKLIINIIDHNEIYKFLLTPRNYRNKIKKIEFSFTYNFDQNIASLNDIKVDNKLNQNLNKILGNLILKKDNLQNKIYFKNLLNDAIKNYSG